MSVVDLQEDDLEAPRVTPWFVFVVIACALAVFALVATPTIVTVTWLYNDVFAG
jgi:hypothetical protein